MCMTLWLKSSQQDNTVYAYTEHIQIISHQNNPIFPTEQLHLPMYPKRNIHKYTYKQKMKKCKLY